MSVKLFVDTNIWIYAHLEQAKEECCGLALAFVQQPLQLTGMYPSPAAYSASKYRSTSLLRNRRVYSLATNMRKAREAL